MKKLSYDNLVKRAKLIIGLCSEQNIKIITSEDPEYPEHLRRIPDCPQLLFVKGNLLPRDRISVAMVGTRKPTEAGKVVATELALELARAGVTIISGLAYGIDTCVHRAALAANGRTIACLGQGVDKVYPKANWELYTKIPMAGALLSEYLPGTSPRPWHFPARNRLISGLALGVVVIEAGQKSGALITANWALEQGRPVMAVPGNVKSYASKGANRLIQDGAYLVTDTEDVLSFLRRDYEYVPESGTHEFSQQVTLEESLVLESLIQRESIEDICENLGQLPVSKTIGLLSSLEIKGLVKSLPGGKYVITFAGQKLIT